MISDAFKVDESCPCYVAPSLTPHPLAWRHEYDGGRAFYTALGHPTEAYYDPTFLGMVARGIVWASGR